MIHSCFGRMVVWTRFAAGYAIAWLPAGVNFDHGRASLLAMRSHGCQLGSISIRVLPTKAENDHARAHTYPDREVLHYVTRTEW